MGSTQNVLFIPSQKLFSLIVIVTSHVLFDDSAWSNIFSSIASIAWSQMLACSEACLIAFIKSSSFSASWREISIHMLPNSWVILGSTSFQSVASILPSRLISLALCNIISKFSSAVSFVAMVVASVLACIYLSNTSLISQTCS